MNLTRIVLKATDYALLSYTDNRDFGPCTGRIDVDDVNRIMYTTFKGTNPTVRDWARNFDPRWKEGVKRHAYLAAESMHRYLGIIKGMQSKFKKYGKVIIGHSQGTAEAGQFYRKYCRIGRDFCFMFAPTPFFRGKVDLGPRAILIINGQDVVSKVGWLLFNHPICRRWYFDTSGKLWRNLTFKQIRQKARTSKGCITKLVKDHPMSIYNDRMYKEFG
jgi:hypothetical protein